MMRRNLGIIILALFVADSSVSAEDCPIKGTWKSNEAMTLASMNATGKVTEKQRAIFENGFFGELTFKASCKEFTTLYADQIETTPYKSIEVKGNTVTVTYFDEVQREDVQRTVTLEHGGRCYSVPIEHLGFKEYFCKVK